MSYRIDDGVMEAIEEHAFSEVTHEVGGVLFGVLEEDGAVVQGCLPALSATADQMSVTFTHEVWDEVHAILDSQHPDQVIVGWYHTHPGFGVFLSSYDLFIHENFFTDERMVALVVDPVAGESGWFAWVDGSVDRVESMQTGREPVPPATTLEPEVAARTRRRNLAPVLLLVGLLLAVGGFLLGQRVETTAVSPVAGVGDGDSTSELLTLRGQVDELQQREADLRQRLAEAEAEGESATLTYRVRPGDTLSRLAYAIYGDTASYEAIVAANPGIDPDRLAVGQVILIPTNPSTGGSDG